MRHLLLPSIIAMLAVPAFATSSLTCDAAGIGATTPNARMKASWNPTVYNIEWYDEDNRELTVQNAAETCAYGSNLVIPSTSPSKTGYTFVGWEMGEQPACLIPSTDVNNNTEWESIGCLDINGAGACADKDGFDQNAPNYGISNPGQWGVTWSNGDKVTGVALCSQTSGTYPNTGTPDETGSGETQYCWCKATHYTANNAQQCSLSSPSWVFYGGNGSAVTCADLCAYSCANIVQGGPAFRVASFGSNVENVAVAQCLIPSTDVHNIPIEESIGCLDINGVGYCTAGNGYDQNAPNYGISDPGEWGLTWSNGDKVTGVALCSQTSGTYATTGTPDETGSGETRYCWCKATHYTANNAQQCSLSAPAWVFRSADGSAASCAYDCANSCAADVRFDVVFRAASFGSNVAQ